MTLADTTFGKMVGIIKDGKRKLKSEDYLQPEDYLSDSEEDEPSEHHRAIEERLDRFGLG